MRAAIYTLARWEAAARLCLVPLALRREAEENAAEVYRVAALGRAHAARLAREGVQAVRGTDGRLERCGIL